ncbi:25995_t:CDS:2, partial [Gigaspora rosea]
ALLSLTKCVRADDFTNFQPNNEAINAAFNFLIGTFIPSALILTFILFNKHPNYSYIVGHLDDLFLFGVCFLLPLIGQLFHRDTLKTNNSILISMLLASILMILICESSYQTGGILILVGFLLLRITYYAQSDKRKVGLLSYLISDIELVGSIKFDKFIEFVNEAENNSVKPFEIKHYTNEKGKKENKRLNLSKKYEISGTSIVIEASDGSDKYIFSVEVELSNNNKG